MGVVLLGALFFASEGSAQEITGLQAVRVASGLSQPLYVTTPPGDYGRLFIVEKGGVIRVLKLDSGVLEQAPFLSIPGPNWGDQGLLGLAFDPEYSTNGKLYVYYTAPGGVFNGGIARLSQFAVTANADQADPTTEKIILETDWPNPDHHGGWIGFSPRPDERHCLYIASGDGGGQNDPSNNGQNPSTRHGKILRIKVDPATATYSIPDNNPYAASTGNEAKEILSLGLRNPFRCGFDRVTGDLFIGDVGQSAREEVSVQKASNPGGGENFGWRLREGTIATPTVGGSPPPGNVEPLYDYPRTIGRTVIGGYPYRGRQLPALRGVYVFGDHLGPEGPAVAPKIFAFDYDGSAASNVQDITAQLSPSAGGEVLHFLTSFGEDANGELYFTDISDGEVFKIVPVTPHVEVVAVTRDGANVVVDGRGVPFADHTLEATSTLVEEFQPIETKAALGDGILQYTDTLSTESRRFYRISRP